MPRRENTPKSRYNRRKLAYQKDHKDCLKRGKVSQGEVIVAVVLEARDVV